MLLAFLLHRSSPLPFEQAKAGTPPPCVRPSLPLPLSIPALSPSLLPFSYLPPYFPVSLFLCSAAGQAVAAAIGGGWFGGRGEEERARTGASRRLEERGGGRRPKHREREWSFEKFQLYFFYFVDHLMKLLKTRILAWLECCDFIGPVELHGD